MRLEQYGLSPADIKVQLTTIINNTNKTVTMPGPLTWSVVILTTQEELDWLAQFAKDEGVRKAVAGVVFCIDYLALRKTCPDNQEFYCTDLVGLLTGTVSTAQLAQAAAKVAAESGWHVSFIPGIIYRLTALQVKLELPPLVLPVALMVLGANDLKMTAKSGYCQIHWGKYDEQNLDLSGARSWWRKQADAWQYGRAARYLALNQLRKALTNFGLTTVARMPIQIQSDAMPPDEKTKMALLQIARKFPRPFFSWQRLRLAWVRFNLATGRLFEAERVVRQLLATEPKAPDALATLGILLWLQGKLQQALGTMAKAQKYAPQEGFICYLMGEMYHEQGLLNQAEDLLLQSLELNREDVNCWLALAKVVEESRGPQAALVVFEQARSVVPPNASLLNKEGLCHSELGQDDKALACYQQALMLRPSDPSILANQGLILGRQGKIEAALKCYDQALKTNPNDIYLLNNKGFCLGKLERYAEALRCYEQALLGQEEDDASLLHNKATCLTKLGRHKEALACYDQVLQYNPTDTATLNNRGLCLLNLGRVRDALECYSMAIQLEPTNAVLWGNKGASLFKQGRYEEALAAYEKALELAPHELAYYSGKGMCLDYLGRGEEAVVCYNRALRLA